MMYIKSSETKLIRTKHNIQFGVGHSVISFKQDLSRIPDHLTLDNIEDDEASGQITLCFIQEQEQP